MQLQPWRAACVANRLEYAARSVGTKCVLPASRVQDGLMQACGAVVCVVAQTTRPSVTCRESEKALRVANAAQRACVSKPQRRVVCESANAVGMDSFSAWPQASAQLTGVHSLSSMKLCVLLAQEVRLSSRSNPLAVAKGYTVHRRQSPVYYRSPPSDFQSTEYNMIPRDLPLAFVPSPFGLGWGFTGVSPATTTAFPLVFPGPGWTYWWTPLPGWPAHLTFNI